MSSNHMKEEELEALEIKCKDAEIELKAISDKLSSAYAYEDKLMERQTTAKEKTRDLRVDLFNKQNHLLQLNHEVKSALDIFTGHFYAVKRNGK